jgi:hypothetical protein
MWDVLFQEFHATSPGGKKAAKAMQNAALRLILSRLLRSVANIFNRMSFVISLFSCTDFVPLMRRDPRVILGILGSSNTAIERL